MQLEAVSPAAIKFLENAAICNHGGDLMAFIRDDDCPESYMYLERKLEKHTMEGNAEKLVTYLLLCRARASRKPLTLQGSLPSERKISSAKGSGCKTRAKKRLYISSFL